MNVLVACEFSGIVRDAFIAKGHNAISADLLPSESPGPHWEGDIIYNFLYRTIDFDLIIAHPPCTYLANSGVRWLWNRETEMIDEERWENMLLACDFFNFFKGTAPKVCIENPIPHGYAKQRIGQYTQIIQPHMFGHGETKATCLWLENLPPLIATNQVDGREGRIHSLPPGPDRWKERSRTFTGIAEAMADQWGGG